MIAFYQRRAFFIQRFDDIWPNTRHFRAIWDSYETKVFICSISVMAENSRNFRLMLSDPEKHPGVFTA